MSENEVCLPEIEGEEEIGDRGWSDVGFRRDFSCHRAVDLSFLRRLYRAHDRRGVVLLCAWGCITMTAKRQVGFARTRRTT